MAEKVVRYGVAWDPAMHPAEVEMQCIRMGGQWKLRNGDTAGLGLFHHFMVLQKLIWPEKVWHKWSIKELECYVNYRIIGVLGPASSGKTFDAATNVLCDYYCFPHETTVLVSSTTRESLEMRVWGEIKKYHRMAKTRVPWLPGHLIEGRQRIVSDPRSEAIEGRDFRNGICGVACKKGDNYQGLGEYVGIKNNRVRLLGDELSLMPRGYVDSISNLNKNPDFKALGLGNPKDVTDALGVLCEPAAHLGGWEGGIDQGEGTKTWPTRFADGICLQLPGSDSPNKDGKLGIPIITQEKIDADIAFYGKDSLQYTMMNEGRMPRGQSLKRVLTRQMCLKFHAMDEPIWANDQFTELFGLDAAYRGMGGDRCMLTWVRMGRASEGNQQLALMQTWLVPVAIDSKDMPEDQIANFVREQAEDRKVSPNNVFFDSTGRGTLMAAFARLWSEHVEPIEFGGQPSERRVSDGVDILCKDYYSKFVTELWFSIRLAIEAGQFRGITDEVIVEGSQREYGIVANRKTEIETKENMKLRSGRSPDLVDALACAVEGARRRGFVIARLANVTRQAINDEWKKDLRQRAKQYWRSGELSYR